MVAQAYYETYSLPVSITHCSNNIGENNEKTNIELVKLILKELGQPESLIM